MKQNYELLDLKEDWVFKRIFGKDGNQDILADFLSAILGKEVKNVQIQNNELTKNKQEQKKSILDIKAVLDNNKIVNVEMQFSYDFNMIDRSLQYATKLYSEQLEKGQKYADTKKVIVIILLNYDLCKRNTYHSIVHMKYEDYPNNTYLKIYDKEEQTLTDKLEIHYIEMSKFLKIEIVEDNKLVQWLQLISGERELIKMALSKKAKAIKKAYEELQYLSQDKQARQEFDDYQRLKLDEEMKKIFAEEKGAKSKQIEIAKKMLEENMDLEFIIKMTGLSKEEIEELK